MSEQVTSAALQPGGGIIGGGRDRADYYLGELERRIGHIETAAADIHLRVAVIKEEMKNVATKHTILLWFVVALITNFLGLVGHLLVRAI